MDLGLDNALANAPPFAVDTEACKRQVDAAVAAAAAAAGDCNDADADADADAGDNGVDNFDSDSEDLGPETAVDADDVDADRNHEPAPPTPPTPPAHAVEEGHVDGALVDNVAESGEESEDEWNYYKGEGERDEHNPSDEPDEPPHSETPCQDNSAWESSSVDMNSSPLNPEAPVFVPGSVAGADVLLAESPRKPLPMDDIELPDVAQFETEADIRPAELLDLDNCDQLNGHHNVSGDEGTKEPFNGNDRCNMDSLGFGFNVGIEPDKVKDTGLIQDFERIQKDTTDFCNIQVFQTHTETNPFDDEGNDELFERLKNKERDPMSMSFYQEKDDDTCERLSKNESHVDLNAVQPLPDSDDEDIQQNGVCENVNDINKENVNPDQHRNLFEPETNMQEPNNDIMILNDRTEVFSNNLCNLGQEDNFVDYNITNSDNIQALSNMEFESSNMSQETVLQTDTPESHKLLFEQIPEIPDGKSSELGFTNDDIQDPSESEKDTRVVTPQEELPQDDMECKVETSTEDEQAHIKEESHEPLGSEHIESLHSEESQQEVIKDDQQDNEILSPLETPCDNLQALDATEDEQSQGILLPEIKQDIMENIEVDVHHNVESPHDDVPEIKETGKEHEMKLETEVTQVEINVVSSENVCFKQSEEVCESHEILHSESLAQEESLLVKESTPSHSPLPTETPLLDDSVLQTNEVPLSGESPLPTEDTAGNDFTKESIEIVGNSECRESPLPTNFAQNESESLEPTAPYPDHIDLQTKEELDSEVVHSEDNTIFADDVKLEQSELIMEAPKIDSLVPSESPLPAKSPVPEEDQNETCSLKESPLPAEFIDKNPEIAIHETPLTAPSACDVQETFEDNVAEEESIELRNRSPLPAEVPLPRESPIPAESPVPTESPAPTASPLPVESEIREEITFAVDNTTMIDTVLTEPSVPSESPIPAASPIPIESGMLSKSPIPVESFESKSPIPDEGLIAAKSPILSESPVPVKSLVLDECTAATESPIPFESIVQAKSPLPVEPLISSESSLPIESSVTAESPVPKDSEKLVLMESPVPAQSPIPGETLESTEQAALSSSALESTISTNEFVVQSEQSEIPIVSHSPVLEPSSGPAPDVVPDESVELAHTMRSELVTDIDIGIPESHAQEICVPVTSEILLDETVQPPAAATPPPTPAVEPAPPAVSEAPLAADPAAPIAAAVAVAAAGAAVTGAVVAAKTKTAAPAKKSPTTPVAKSDSRTPKSASKTTATPRTPSSAAKKPDAAARPSTATSRQSTTKTPTTTAKSTTPATKPATAISKTATPASKPATPATKSATPASRTTSAAKQVTSATKTTTTASKPTTPAAAAASRTTAAKPASPTTKPAVREAPAAVRAAPKTTSAPRPAAPKPAPKAAPAPRPAPARAPPAPAKPALAKPKPKPTDKPLTNGDAKDTKPAAKPAPRTAPAARPITRAPAAPTTAPPKIASTKPAPRATAPLDKQSKDLANKRITAKTAPPRTALTKTTTGAKNSVMKSVPKKPVDSLKKEQIVKEALANGGADEPVKLPPSPPAPDNALLPDVIA